MRFSTEPQPNAPRSEASAERDGASPSAIRSGAEPAGEARRLLVVDEEAAASSGELGVAPISGARLAASWILGLSCAAVIASALQFASGQTERGFYLYALCLVVVFAAAWSDVATRRIPNVLTYPAVLLGLAFNGVLPLVLERAGATTPAIMLGSSGTVDCVAGFGLCAAIGIVSFVARGLGGGDVKLLAAVGAMLGFQLVVAVLFNTLLVAAAVGILNWTAGGALMRRLQAFAHAIYFSVVLRADMRSVYRFKSTEGPFALSLLVGVVSAPYVALHREIFGVVW